ncbi:MAG: NUDIX domain-containing protein [Candidatus Taylorbacteria bacterium]|nr:NUDIX domain-containing protein [Candidatus Taylorbacteria bacterium]
METKKVGVGFGVLVLKEGKILLGRRHTDPSKADSELHGEGTWTMPGGKLEFGETFEEGAIRELKEETSLVTQVNDLEIISLANNRVPDAHFVTIGLVCTAFEGTPSVMEPDEITEWDWFSIDDLPDPLFSPSAEILENYKEGVIYRK